MADIAKLGIMGCLVQLLQLPHKNRRVQIAGIGGALHDPSSCPIIRSFWVMTQEREKASSTFLGSGSSCTLGPLHSSMETPDQTLPGWLRFRHSWLGWCSLGHGCLQLCTPSRPAEWPIYNPFVVLDTHFGGVLSGETHPGYPQQQVVSSFWTASTVQEYPHHTEHVMRDLDQQSKASEVR